VEAKMVAGGQSNRMLSEPQTANHRIDHVFSKCGHLRRYFAEQAVWWLPRWLHGLFPSVIFDKENINQIYSNLTSSCRVKNLPGFVCKR